MERLGHNILRLARERKLSLPKLAELAEVDKGNLSRLVRTSTGYSDKSIRRIADALGVTLGVLFADELAVRELPGGFRQVPILDKIHAGAFASVDLSLSAGEMTEFILTSLPVSARAFAMRVEGDSMIPDFLPGARVVVDPDMKPKPRNYVVAVDDTGEATLKIYAPRGFNEHGQDVFALVPANPYYPTLRSDQQELRIIGVVREHISANPQAPIK